MSGCMMDVNACDGIQDCQDGSDENLTMCKVWYFLFLNKIDIWINLILACIYIY